MRNRPLGVVVGGALLAMLAPATATTTAGAHAPTGTTVEAAVPSSARSAQPATGRAAPDVTFTSTRGSGFARDVITCEGTFRGGRSYDAPHPGKSSQRRAVNAHLDISCRGGGAGATSVTVTSVMVDGRRAGDGSRSTGLRRARTGGDLRCVPQKRRYQAKGVVSIKFPPRYDPPTATARPASQVKAFKRGPGGRCVAP